VGEDLAYVTGTEPVNLLIGKDQVQADLRVSNVFRREGSEWKMVHQHVDRNLTMLEILSKLETSHVSVWAPRGTDCSVVEAAQAFLRTQTETFLPMRRFLNPVFMWEGFHSSNCGSLA